MIDLSGSPFSERYKASLRELVETVETYQRLLPAITATLIRQSQGGGGGGRLPLVVTDDFQAIGSGRWKYGFKSIKPYIEPSQAWDGITMTIDPDGISGTVESGWAINTYEMFNDGLPPEQNGSDYIGGPGAKLILLPLRGAVSQLIPLGRGPGVDTIYAIHSHNPTKVSCVLPTPIVGGTGGSQGNILQQLIVQDLV